MTKEYFKKGIVLGIIVLFLGAAVIPCIGSSSSLNSIKIIEETKPQKLILTYTYNPTDDAYLKEDHPDQNLNIIYMNIRNEYGGGGSPGWSWQGIIKFDISSLPPGTIIDSAKLNLYYYYYEGFTPEGRPLSLYRALADWDENTVTWNNQPPCTSQPSTYAFVPSGFGWMTWNVTKDAQDFIDGHKDNYGWKITDDTYWGDGDIPTTRFCCKEYGAPFIPYLEIEIPNHPPQKPTINGPTSGKTGTSYVFTTTTTDPDGDKLSYWFDWGDGTNSGWVGPYNSGATAYESHIWTSKGTFIVKVKASDINGAASDWSDPLLITMPRTKTISNPFFFNLIERYTIIFPILQKLLNRLEQ